jgi:hypothetical protein
MTYAEQVLKLTADQRLHFYEVLAHNLTVAIRGVWSDESMSDAEKVNRMKHINEILHRVTAKVYVERLKTHEWTEDDFGNMICGWVGDCERLKTEVFGAINRSYQAITGKEIDQKDTYAE